MTPSHTTVGIRHSVTTGSLGSMTIVGMKKEMVMSTRVRTDTVGSSHAGRLNHSQPSKMPVTSEMRAMVRLNCGREEEEPNKRVSARACSVNRMGHTIWKAQGLSFFCMERPRKSPFHFPFWFALEIPYTPYEMYEIPRSVRMKKRKSETENMERKWRGSEKGVDGAL